jgi:hypothetical protein
VQHAVEIKLILENISNKLELIMIVRSTRLKKQ